MPPHLEMGRIEKPRVDVGRHDVSRWADSLAEPLCDGAPSATDLEAAPSRTHADGFEPPNGEGVGYLLQRFEPFQLARGIVVEKVRHHGIIPHIAHDV
ncbi:hypothetical protein LVJ94_08580 [Pendulispora rubella]|uniref:Uncharacterized protein n=1 Tax=Pendulispora rubella TaxID=2741070 RepID=A0ABZ2LBW6_9BACT